MSVRSVAIVAVVLVGAIALFDFTVAGRLDPRGFFWYGAILRTSLFLLVAAAAAATARRFRWWDEYAGRAWTLFFVAYTLLACSEIARRFFPGTPNARELLVAIGNLSIIGAYVLIARSLRAAGLEYYGSAAGKIAFMAVAIALAVALCSGSLLTELANLRSGQPHVGSIISVLADITTFILVAPLLLTAFALRGGRLFWVFAFLTAGTFGWMVNQGAGTVFRAIGTDAVRTGRIFGFALACSFIAAAAFTQWLAAQRGTTGVTS